MDKVALKRKLILKRLEHIDQPPTALGVYSEILNAIHAQESADRIADLVRVDPTLTMRTLTLANSVRYNRGVARIADIDNAIVMIGMEEFERAVMTLQLVNVFSNFGSRYQLLSFYKHSLMVAHAAAALSVSLSRGKVSRKETSEIFTVGLLHDMGIVLMIHNCMETYLPIIGSDFSLNISLLEKEQRGLGIDHAEVGGMIAARWGFSANQTDIIAWHHQYDQYKGSQHLAFASVYLADILVNNIGLGYSPGIEPSQRCMEAFQLDGEHISALNLDWNAIVGQVEPLLEVL